VTTVRPPASAVTPYRRARFRFRAYVSEHPPGYLAFARHKWQTHNVEVIGPDTELVIDGYTRSATTFAVYAFQLAQDKPVRLAHHLHAPAQLIEAARRSIPVLALIREPRGAILSQLIRYPHVALRDALVAYSRFYECLRPYRASFVAGEFGQVTGDFGAVVRRLNERFGTEYREFAATGENIREVFELSRLREAMHPDLLRFESGLISRDEMRSKLPGMNGEGPAEDRDAWIPTEDRKRAKDALRELWEQPSLARLRTRAELAYQQFLAG
jgi:hypothetical protein